MSGHLPSVCPELKAHQAQHDGAVDLRWFAAHVRVCKQCQAIMRIITGDVYTALGGEDPTPRARKRELMTRQKS